MAWSGTTNGNGAIQRTDSGQNAPNGEGYGNGGTFNFNASRSSSIYGASTTVQPPTIALIPQVKY